MHHYLCFNNRILSASAYYDIENLKESCFSQEKIIITSVLGALVVVVALKDSCLKSLN